MKKLTYLLLCLVISIGLATAQTTKVKGTIISEEDGQPIIGATVMVKGVEGVGTVTDFNGEFTLDVPSSAKTLVVSYVGMETLEAEVKPEMKIYLKPSSEALDEVMVVAYGTAKKSSFTGSASTIKGEKIQKMQSSNISKSLEGAVAGVQTTQSSGQPGSSADIYVRGIGSISASKAALIVVDGVPYEGSLNQIAPSDIESMTVLKDAAANSLYGSRGANGVVLITTKRGQSGKPKVVFENRTGFNTRGVATYDVLSNPGEYYELFWEAMRNSYMKSGYSALAAGQMASNNLVSTLGGYNNYNVANTALIDPVTGKLNPNAQLLYHDDWLDEAFRPGVRQENTLSVSGGTEKTQYYVSVNYLYDDSYTDNSDFDRLGARLKLDQQVTDWLKVGMNMAYTTVKTNSPDVGSTTLSSIFYFGQSIAPIYPVYVYDADGNRVLDQNGNPTYDYGAGTMGQRPFGSNTHPIDVQRNNIYKGTTDVINAKAYAEVKFLKDFTFTANVSIDNFNSREVAFQTPIGGDAANVGGRGSVESQRYYVMNANQLLNWNHTFNKTHNFEVLLGHETKHDRVESVSASKENFFDPSNPELVNGGLLTNGTSSAAEYSLEGYFGQVKYNYNEKYYMSASYRLDGSSRFAPENRWGSFWSVGASWRMNHESFLEDKDWIDDLKIKASFGTQGNDNILNNQPYLDQYQVVNNNGELGLQYVFRGNREITWEKSNNFNAGVEFRFWNRLSGNIEYFNKTTWDLLYYKPLSPSQGTPAGIYENCMRMRNQGVEIELNVDIFNTNDFKWTFGLNATHLKNTLLELPEDKPQDGWVNGNYFMRVGAPLYNYYDYKYVGVDPNTGDALYLADVLDENNNVIGTTTVNTTERATRYELGKSPIPALYGGFNSYWEYKGFDLNLGFAYQIGGWVYDSLYSGFMSAGRTGTNWHTDIYDRWTPDNRNTDVPRLSMEDLQQGMNGDRSLTKASYLSLRNATLGYTFPKRMLSKAKIEKLRLYVVGDNLFLLSARKGLDPRQSITGDTGYNYSAVRTVSFGINLEF